MTKSLNHRKYRFPPGPSTTPVLTTITISGPSSVVLTHATAAYTAVGYDQTGLVMASGTVTPVFASSDATIATINSSTGIATSVALGTTNITASAVNSAGGLITSNTIPLTVQAQVPTTVTVAPASFTLSTVGATQALTATVTDQMGGAISSPTLTWTSAQTGVATVASTGLLTALVTAVAAGPVTITAACTAPAGSAAGTATGTVSTGGTVTAVTVLYNNASAAQLLFRTGVAYPLVATDQGGNLLDGTVGSWSSSDPTHAPVNASTGIVSPTALTAATFTYTHTASGHTGTGTATVLPATTPIMFDAMRYASDAAFRANIWSTVNTNGSTYTTPLATGTSSNALYVDGINAGLLALDATRPFMGSSVITLTLPGGTAAYGHVDPYLTSTRINHAPVSRTWLLTVKRYDPGFTTVGGTGIGGAAAYKDQGNANWHGFNGQARTEYSNTNELELYANLINGSTGVGGVLPTGIGSETTEWTSGLWLAEIVLVEVRSSTVVATQSWRWYIGNHPLTGALLVSPLLQGPETDGQASPTIGACSPFGINYNQTRTTDLTLHKSVAYWEMVDGTVYGDPYGLLGDTTAPTLTGISGGTVTHGTTGNSIVLTGTHFTAHCWPVFSNAKIYTQSITVNSSTQLTVVVNVDATATTGAGTVLVHNGALLADSATQPVTVS